MVSVRVVYSISRYWRCYALLLIASFLSFILIYISQNDPQLEYYFPYFKLGSYYFYTNNGKNMNELMENTSLDYEFLRPNSKMCLNFDYAHPNHHSNNNELKLAFLIISQTSNFKARQAARQTFGKEINRMKLKMLFFVGNLNYERTIDQTQPSSLNINDEQAKLNKEIADYGDIIQINMPDNENYTTTKTLIALRWSITYCLNVQYVYVLSDSAILNHQLLNDFIFKRNLLNQQHINDSVIAGYCNYTDEKLAVALNLFFDEYSNKLKEEIEQKMKQQSTSATNTTKEKSNKNKSLNKRDAIAASSSSSTSTSPKASSALSSALNGDRYKGQYCSGLGWLLSINAAKKLWLTALSSPYIMRVIPAYISGYLAFKANLKHLSLFEYEDQMPLSVNCLKIFQLNANKMLCAENFTISNRYANYMATWNTYTQNNFVFSKL